MSKAKLFSKMFSHRASRPAPGLRGALGFAFRCLFLFGLLTACPRFAGAQTNITEFGVPSAITWGPDGIACGADGAYWFAEYFVPNNPGLIGRIDTVSNVFTQYNLLTNNDAFGARYAYPFDICPGPPGDNTLWFTESGSSLLGRMNTNGTYREYALTNTLITNGTITAGPDGNIWFIEYNVSKIAYVVPPSPTNTATTLPVHEYGPFATNISLLTGLPGTNLTYYGGPPGTNAYMFGLTTGPDGNLWFTQSTYGTVGKLNPSTGAYTCYLLPNTNCEPVFITTGADGALWFAEYNSDCIGRLTADGRQFTEYPIPPLFNYATPNPYGILATPDGNIWFTEYSGSAIGRLNPNAAPSGVFTIFPTPTGSSSPTFIATGPDSNIWFCEYVDAYQGHNTFTKNIGRLIVNQSLSLSLAQTNLTGPAFSGVLADFDNSTSNDTVEIEWGDGTSQTLNITDLSVTNPSLSVTNVFTAGFTNSMTITQITPINTTNNNNGTFGISVNHTYVYSAFTNYTITLTVTDPRGDTAIGYVSVNSAPFFTGESVAGGKLVLSVSGTPGRTYTIQSAGSLINPVWNFYGSVTLPANSSAATITNTISSSERFFRLRYP